MLVDHLAFLTDGLQALSDSLPAECRRHAIETFPGEGTQEQYLDLPGVSPRLLLLEPIGDGPYRRSLSKRGPGLHHLGATTPSLSAIVPALAKLGLLLHPISILTRAEGVVWLCRPGIPFLIELAEAAAEAPGPAIVLGLPKSMPLPEFGADLFRNLSFRQAAGDGFEVQTGKLMIPIPSRATG